MFCGEGASMFELTPSADQRNSFEIVRECVSALGVAISKTTFNKKYESN
jgi:hypothetical protein